MLFGKELNKFVNNVDKDKTAQSVQSDLRSTLALVLLHIKSKWS